VRYPIVRPIVAAQWLGALLVSVVLNNADAAGPRKLFFSIEPPEKYSQEPPTSAQIRTSEQALEIFSGRVRSLEIDGHVDAPSADKADVLVQVTSLSTALGLRAGIRIYDHSTRTWHEIEQILLTSGDSTQVESELANRFLPRTIVRLLELAHPIQQPIILADCVFPDKNNAHTLQNTALALSSDYPHSLSAKNRIRQRFSIVRLVPTMAQGFYRWWCIDAGDVRRATFRDDTMTVSGHLVQRDAAAKPELQVVLRWRGQIQPRPVISIDDQKIAVQRIADMVETFADEQ